MPSIDKCFILFSLAFSVSALTTPHVIRNVNHHRAVAAAFEAAVPEPVLPSGTRVRRRSNSDRCKPKSTSSSPAASTPIANLEGAPPSTSHSSSLKSTPKSTPKAAHTASSEMPAASGGGTTSGGNLPSYMKGTQIGQGTYYATGLGACGITNNDGQHIAAVSHLLFDTFPGYNGANSNNNPLCGKKVTATYQGKSVTVTLTDRCVGCKIADLDFSPSAFSQLADQAVGRISGMRWTWD